MANLYSNQYPLQDPTRANPSRYLAANVASGSLQVANIDYVLTAAVATNDVIYLCKLPVGSIVVPGLCSASTVVDAGTSLTLHVGYAGNPDAYAQAISLAAVGEVKFNSGTFPSGAMASEPMTSDDLIATVTLAAAPTAAVIVHFVIVYITPRG